MGTMTLMLSSTILFHILLQLSVASGSPPDPRSSENATKWYLSRAATVSGVLAVQYSQPSIIANNADTIRMIIAMGTRYVGRSVYVWGNDQDIPLMLTQIQSNAAIIHGYDPSIILEGAIFEIVTKSGVESIEIPAYVLKAFNQPIVNRTFSYRSMLFPDGSYVNHWGPNESVPDMTQLETRLWFYYVGTQYIQNGIEALHCGQIMLMSKNDNGMILTYQLLDKLRIFATTNARRGFVICNAHLYEDPWVHLNGTDQLIWDLHAFPSRPQPHPDEPGEQCTLNASFEDAIYLKSAGGVAVGGWHTNSLPYMVELDNYSCTNHTGSQDPNDTYHPFGYDEISWFAHQPDTYRNNWLEYAARWLAQNDPTGHFEMPGTRILCAPTTQPNSTFYDASKGDVHGFGQENTIANIWATQKN